MEKKNVHGGHRARVKERFLRDGLDGFEKHNVLELLLFYALPQRDTNPIAHALINRFGSVRGVLEASVEDLCTIDGISEHSATLLKLMPAVWRYAASEVERGERFESLNKLGRKLVTCYAGLTVETILLVLLDNSGRILEIVKVGEGSVNQVRMETRKLIEHAIRTNASMAVLAHNHPNGNAVPSTDDISTTEAVAKAFEAIHVEFIDHLVIAGDRFEPIWSKYRGVFWQRPSNAFYDTDGEDLQNYKPEE